jgi:hypothetical protein
MSQSQKRPPAQKRQGPPAAPSNPFDAVVPENPFEHATRQQEAERVAKEAATEKAEECERAPPQAKEEAQEKAQEEPTEQPQGQHEPPELWEIGPGEDLAAARYEDRDFLTLRQDEGLANLPPIRVTNASLSKVVSAAKRLGKKADSLNKTGADERHLAVIARWYEGEHWQAIHDFLTDQGRRPEWVPTYRGAGVTAKQISRATRLRRAFAKVEDLKKIASLDEAEALATCILNNKKDKQSARTKDADTGAGASGSPAAPGTSNKDSGTGEVAADEGEAKKKAAHARKRRKPRNQRTRGAALPPDPVELVEVEFKAQYSPDNLLDLGVQILERGLGRAAVGGKPCRVDAVLDDLATVAVAAAEKKVRDIDTEDAEARESVQRSVKTLLDFAGGPARRLDPTWQLKLVASWLSVVTEESVRVKWGDPNARCDVDKAIDSLDGSLHTLKKRRAEGQEQ